MDFFGVIKSRRTIRRFKQKTILVRDLKKIIDSAKMVPCGYNRQPVKFIAVRDRETAKRLFEFTGWWTGKPSLEQAPTGYVLVLADESIAPLNHDSVSGLLAGYSVMLAAWALGYGSCWHGGAKDERLKKFFNLPNHLVPYVFISLGFPAEEIEIVPIAGSSTVIKKIAEGKMKLPKRSIKEVLWKLI